MEADRFPRTMRRGMFKGERFETHADYAAAVKRRQNGRKGDEPAPRASFHLSLAIGTAKLELEGDPRNGADLDALLSALGSIPMR